MAYKKIILALQGTEDEAPVIREAMRLLDHFEAELSTVHVNDPAAGKAHLMMGSLPLVTADDIRRQIADLGYGETSRRIQITLLEGEKYANEIAKASVEADLLIMGHHPKNRFMASLTDSTDEQVADRVQCPMLLVPCPPAK